MRNHLLAPSESGEPRPLREFVFTAHMPVTVRVRAEDRKEARQIIACRDYDIFVDYLAHNGTGDGPALWITYGSLDRLARVTFREEDPDDETAARLARLPASELLPTFEEFATALQAGAGADAEEPWF